MIRRLLLLASALPLAGASPAQSPPAQAAPAASNDANWLISDRTILFRPAPVAFPRSAGALSSVRHLEFSREGEGIDNGIQYRSTDGAIIGMVYIYYPGLPHSGLAAVATDNAVRLNSDTQVSGGEARVVAAGGAEGVAIRADYAGYRGMASSAAFIKAGRWIIKLRVSGPEPRRAEVDASMAALLAGIQFGAATHARAATPIAVRDCPAGSGQREATLLADPPGAEIAALGMLATFDGGGIEAADADGSRRDLPPRVPAELCLSARVETRAGRVPIYRGEEGPPRALDGQTRLIAALSDSGITLEVVQVSNLGRYLVLYHEIGATSVLGGFDGVPSDAQVAEMMNNPNAAAAERRATVVFRPGESDNIHIRGEAPQRE